MSFPQGSPNEFSGITWVNWRTHPWQMWGLSALVIWSVGILLDNNAIIQGTPPSELNNPRMLNLIAAAMLIGALISLTGLHMKDREFGIWAEMSGYVVLVATLMFYLAMAFILLGPHDSLSRVGTPTTIGYVMSMSVRSYQIVRYQMARAKVTELQERVIEEAEKFNERD